MMRTLLSKKSLCLALLLNFGCILLVQNYANAQPKPISMSPFGDSMRHWYGIRDAGNIIQPKKNQAQYTEAEITKIADNILLFQRNNGGWPKNYDMQAILLPEQIDSIIQTKVQTNTTFDNSTTYTHIEYLANVYAQTHTEKYRVACLKGLEFVLSAQFKNGGWPQYFPLEKGDYSRHITFNDGAYMGIMNLLQNIVDNHPDFSFVDTKLRKRIAVAYQKGLDCILKMQIVDQEKLTVWCQQHDEVTLQPAWARAFEPPAICNGESAGIVLFLMSIDRPDARIIQAVQSAVKWFNDSKIQNTRVETIDAPTEKSQYQTYSVDKVVVNDPKAPPIWTRYYELNTERPLFSDRNKKFLYSMAEVSRERRVGYAWYTYAPQSVLNKYPEWQKKWAPEKNILNVQVIPRDTSFTPYQAWIKIKKEFPQAQIVKPSLPVGVVADMNIIYATLSETPYGKRDLHFDLFRPEKSGKYPALLLVHGGGWRSGNKSMQVPMAQQIAAKGYVTASVEYRLSPEALYPAAVHDIKAAIRFLRANASKYNIDPDKIAITGSSAGGQLAALIGATSGVEKFEGNGGNPGVSSAVQAIIDMDGVLDFDTPDEKGKDEETAKRSAGALWFGTTFNQNSEKWIEASPIHYVGKNTPPMLFINSALPRFHYGRDSVIAILDKHKIYSEVHTIENTPHPFWLFHPWFEPTVKYMVDFLDKVMK